MKIIAKRITLIVPALCMVLLILTLFMPYYEGSRCDTCVEGSDFGIVRTYEVPEVGLMVVYYGFASVFLLFNLILGLLLTIASFSFPRVLATPIVVTVLFLLAIALLNFGNSAGWGRPVGDSMLGGFVCTVVTMVVLLLNAFVRAYQMADKPVAKDQAELLDN